MIFPPAKIISLLNNPDEPQINDKFNTRRLGVGPPVEMRFERNYWGGQSGYQSGDGGQLAEAIRMKRAKKLLPHPG